MSEAKRRIIIPNVGSMLFTLHEYKFTCAKFGSLLQWSFTSATNRHFERGNGLNPLRIVQQSSKYSSPFSILLTRLRV
jgi:hypothetical protein